jgi:type IV secretory pathway VirB10-like protein
LQHPEPSFTSEKKAAAPSRPAVYTFGGSGQSMPEYMKPKAPPAPPAPDPTTSIAYKSATVPGAKSMTIADRNLLLMPGPLICIMDTTINTDVAGPFQCHLDRDAVSPTNVVLMEKGTKVQGGYTSAVTQGQSRVIAVTANAITPNGVVVPLGGPIDSTANSSSRLPSGRVNCDDTLSPPRPRSPSRGRLSSGDGARWRPRCMPQQQPIVTARRSHV